MKKILKGFSIATAVAFPTYYVCQSQNEKSFPEPAKVFKNRSQHVQDIQANSEYDIVIIGGGCNGAGVLLDSSTRGFRTLLIEKNDFASGSSSKSTKLIHGGVRYLEQVFAFTKDSPIQRWKKFLLVKEAIRQRGFMIRNANYMNEKKPFIIPCQNSFQSFYYYIGSVFYYGIYWFWCPSGTTHFNFPYFVNRHELRDIFPYISEKYSSGVVYQDGCFNDSRMLLTSLLTSSLKKQQHSSLPDSHIPANILNKAQFLDFIKNQEGKITGVTFQDKQSKKIHKIKSKYVVNCTGTWSDQIRLKDQPNLQKRICIVGGSHITYNQRIGNSKFGLCLPSKDGRILLVVPWLDRIIAGTTEKKYESPVTNPTISVEQRKFINETLNDTLASLSPADLIDSQISRWTGLRPLVLNVQEGKPVNTKDVSRSHVIEKSSSGLYSLMGGKWTTFRKMGQDVVDDIVQREKEKGKTYRQSMTETMYLVGCSSPKLQESLIKQHGEIGNYLYKTYGSLALNMLQGDLTLLEGIVTKAQLQHIVKNEMVTEVEDVLLRRTRTTFLYDKMKTISLIPIVAEILLKEKQGKVDQNKLQKLINESVEKITSYEFD